MGWLRDYAEVTRGFVGLGFLAMPLSFARVGAVAACVLALACALAGYCAMLLLDAKYALRRKGRDAVDSYGDVVAAVLGARAALALDVILYATHAGFIVSYCVFLSGALPIASEWHFVVLLLALAPLCVLHSVPPLLRALGSAASTAALLCGLALLAAAPMRSAVQLASGRGLAELFGTCASCVCGIGLVLPYEAAMQERQPSPHTTLHYKRLLGAALATLAVLLTVFGVLGARAWGSTAHAALAQNFASSSLALGSLVSATYMLVPLQFSVLRTLSEQHLLRDEPSAALRVVWRFAMLVILVWVSLRVPTFGIAYALVGALGGSLLSFVVPLVLHLRLQVLSASSRVLHFSLLGGALAIMAIATIASSRALFNSPLF